MEKYISNDSFYIKNRGVVFCIVAYNRDIQTGNIINIDGKEWKITAFAIFNKHDINDPELNNHDVLVEPVASNNI